MLSIRIDYLMGSVYAGDFADRSQPEWPPHPARLFSATVSALHDSQNAPHERTALQWLAQQGLPNLHCSGHTSRASLEAYVVTNYESKSGTVPAVRERQKRFFPVVRPDSPHAYFIWPNAEPTPEILRALDGILQRIGYLGRSHSVVCVSLCHQPPEPTLIPNASGGRILRVFGRNRVEELEAAHNAQLWPLTAPQQTYIEVGKPQKEAAAGPFGDMLILAFGPGLRFPIDLSLRLTSLLRKAVMELAGRSSALSDFVHGHSADPVTPAGHVAFVALADIDHPNARGEIKGLAVVLPRHAPVPRRRDLIRVLRTLTELRGKQIPSPIPLRLEEAIPPGETLDALRPETWSRSSQVWATATPIVLDRYPKSGLSAEDIVRESIHRSGLPAPTTVLCSPFSVIQGVPPAGQFVIRRKKDEPKRWAAHASIEFDEDVRGPLLLGAGRYFGLGLCRPFDVTKRGGRP